MREILFRGKCQTGEWVCGGFVSRNGKPEIVECDRADDGDFTFTTQVDPTTVGQFTGLHDKNGVEIYEGDIYTAFGSQKYEIRFISGSFCGGLLGGDDSIFAPLGWESLEDDEDLFLSNELFKIMEIIGNIHEGATPCTSAIVE